MGTYSHHQQLDERDLMRLAPPPPVRSRMCTGNVYVQPGPRVPEGGWVQCGNCAVAFVPEVAFCAHHMPPDWIGIAQQRKLRWAQWLELVWHDVLDEYPTPSHLRHEVDS